MTIKEISSIEKGKYLVHFEEGQVLVLYKSDIKKTRLAEGISIDEERYQEISTEIILPRAKNHAMYYLSHRIRSVKEVATYLTKKHYEDHIIESVLAFLQHYGYIDDQKYTRSFINDQLIGKPVGVKAIQYKLRQKGIDSETVANVIEEMELDEAAHCLKLLRKKAKSKTLDYKEKSKVYAYLQRRGFSYSGIQEAFQRYENEEEDKFNMY